MISLITSLDDMRLYSNLRQNCRSAFRMGITIFKILIWGGTDIRFGNPVYCSARESLAKLNSDSISDDIISPNENYSYLLNKRYYKTYTIITYMELFQLWQ